MKTGIVRLAEVAGGRALWFSKNLIPAMRREAKLRAGGDPSPVCRHIGLYAYRLEALRRYVSLPEGRYEQLEGLEQLRLLENGMTLEDSREVDPQTPHALPPTFPEEHRGEFPYQHPVVFRSGQYVVHRVSGTAAPLNPEFSPLAMTDDR